ncbi:hypothetical protein HY029_04390 [Candidatus Gottesmanbacteria bacterium]|nr:hypothetical protein [Candidatus Gottesmanbacteria bacterium]
MPNRLHDVFFDGKQARTVQQVLSHLRANSQPDFDLSGRHSLVTAEFLGMSPAVKFSSFGPRQMVVNQVFISRPFDNQVTLFMLGNSVCNTDLSIVQEFKAGRREDVADVVTIHEGYGVAVSVGGDVPNRLHKKLVILDSHASGNHFIVKDGDLEYHTDSYAQCAPLGCDTIVAGVTPRVARGA